MPVAGSGVVLAGEPAYTQQQTTPPAAPTPSPAPAPAPVPTAAGPYSAMPPYIPYGVPDEDRRPNHAGSAYIPVDSWVYPEMTRLYSLGFADTLFLGMRPWTRQSLLHALDESEDDIRDSNSEEAQQIFTAVRHYLATEVGDVAGQRPFVYGTESVYTRLMGISGPPLNNSWYFGQSIVNDYGRPFQSGFNAIAGASTLAEYGRFSLYIRGEYQHAPPAPGFSFALAQQISQDDGIAYTGANQRQLTIPLGPIAAANPFRLVEATLSFHIAGHEISGGKTDAWLGPGQGAAMAYSNNAEQIYAFRIDRVEPLHIPYLSALIGPVRYEFFYGDLKGHTVPNHPYTHTEQFSFRPTANFEFGFARTIVFGGEGHEPVTLHTFLKGFFDPNDTTAAEKIGRDDPGARFTAFNAAYRLPFLRKYMTFYVDSFSHDDVTPISAPRRAAYRTGLYLSQVPGLRKLDVRVEAASTDPRVTPSSNGLFIYSEGIQKQAYTNNGFTYGDWVGREAKGGNAWLTYHFSGSEWARLSYLNKKNDKDFVGGTTQNQFKFELEKRFLHNDLEMNAWVQYEGYKAPLLVTGKQTDFITAFQFTYYPGLKTRSIH